MQFLYRLFAENVWPLIWLIALVELILVIAMVGTGRGRFLLWIGSLALFAVLLVGVEWLWVTDAERIDGAINQVADAVRREDADGILRHLAPQCRFGSYNRDAIGQQAEALFRQVEFDRVTISQRKTQVFRLRKQATAEFLAVARGKQSGVEFNPYPTRWILTFIQAEDGLWQVMDIQQLQAFGDGDRPVSTPDPAGLPRI